MIAKATVDIFVQLSENRVHGSLGPLHFLDFRSRELAHCGNGGRYNGESSSSLLSRNGDGQSFRRLQRSGNHAELLRGGFLLCRAAQLFRTRRPAHAANLRSFFPTII
ncbi:hypothetical protein [Rhodoblastus sp.]|uniref:hypothetical protein n=1 Tax=Rhodoblastus sp. TaxID=1962975 RepID=UPI0025F1FD17|nr:hypothetical protein [Rhodoblastus sp.]